jgi:hypothetical protein
MISIKAETLHELVAERDALKLALEKMTEDRDRWADSACRLEKAFEAFKWEI